MMIIFTIISKEKFNEILRSESEEVKYNRIGEYNSYDKILQLFDHRRRSNNFDEKYLYIFSDLDNLEENINIYHKNLINRDNAYCLNEVKIFGGSKIKTEVFNFPGQYTKTTSTNLIFFDISPS